MKHPLTLTLVAFVCTAIAAFLSRKIIGKNLESLVLMGTALLLGGVVMWIVDAIYGSRRRSDGVDSIEPYQAVGIGLCQTLSAVFPGITGKTANAAFHTTPPSPSLKCPTICTIAHNNHKRPPAAAA